MGCQVREGECPSLPMLSCDSCWLQRSARHPWVWCVGISPLGAEHTALPVRGQGQVLSQHPAARLHGSYINLHQLRNVPRPSHLPRAAAQTGPSVKAANPNSCTCSSTAAHSSGQAGAPGLAQDTQVSEPRPCRHSAPPGVAAGPSAARLL